MWISNYVIHRNVIGDIMKLTEHDVIQKSEHMFRWIADYVKKHPECLVKNWSMNHLKRLYFEQTNYDDKVPLSYCFACEYNHKNPGHYCGAGCILAPVWNDRHCAETNSYFYFLIKDFTADNIVKQSIIIADRCKRLLDETQELSRKKKKIDYLEC